MKNTSIISDVCQLRKRATETNEGLLLQADLESCLGAEQTHIELSKEIHLTEKDRDGIRTRPRKCKFDRREWLDLDIQQNCPRFAVLKIPG